jgi:predicted amidohydrolase
MMVSIAQLNSNDNTIENLKIVLNLICLAKTNGSEIIFFPENTLYFRISSSDKVQPIQLGGPELVAISNCCHKNKIAVHLTTPLQVEDKVFNSSVLIDQEGQIEILYNKIHLFDIELAGKNPIKESDSFEHGTQPKIFQFGDFKFGSSICYDVRFAELYNWYAKQNVDVILVPAAFLVPTGKAHWEVLLRARAIESQCYILAPAQVGLHKSSKNSETRETFGHSMAINPWGEIIEKKISEIGLINFDLKKDEILKVRSQIPMSLHRRKI